MSTLLGDLKPVYVVGIGWHRYQAASDTSHVELALKAARDALDDAGISWHDIEDVYLGTARLGMAPGRDIIKHLGAHGQSLVHIDNASASGSAAFRHGCITVAAGMADVAMVLGVDKLTPLFRQSTGVDTIAGDAIQPFTHFALLTNEYVQRFGIKPEDIALVALKNHNNGALNPNAHRQQERTLDEILEGRKVSGDLTVLQCCPVGEGGAAVIVASEEGIQRLGIDPGRAVRVASSAALSESTVSSDRQISVDGIRRALIDAQVPADQLDVIELHDGFPIEELHYAEASGICPEGHFVPLLKEGAFAIGGKCAVSPSGGLLAMGHPVGPTGVGQIGEITMQLRGEAGLRQQPNARTGLAHMVGLGAVCYAHVLVKP